MTDVFAMQDEIAAAIAAALELKLVGKRAARLHQPHLRAYEAFRKARHEMLKIAPEAAARARQLLEQAIELDPAYSEPHAELAHYFLLQGLLGLRSSRETMPTAGAQAQKVLDFAPGDARAHGVLCAVAGQCDYDWQEAGEQFRLALAAELVPSEVRARCALSYLLPLKRLQEAMEQCEKALEQDPLKVFVRLAFALVLGIAEMHERAVAEAQAALEIDANSWGANFAIALTYVLRGELTEAREAAERSVRAAPWHPQPVGILAGILARLGNMTRADELLTKLKDMAPVGLLLYHCCVFGRRHDYRLAREDDRKTRPLRACMELPQACAYQPTLACPGEDDEPAGVSDDKRGAA